MKINDELEQQLPKTAPGVESISSLVNVPRKTHGQLKTTIELQKELNKKQNQNKNLKNKTMSKFDHIFLSKHGIKIVLVIVLLLSYFKGCSIDSEVELIKKELRHNRMQRVDTLSSQLVNEEEMIYLIKNCTCMENSKN